MKTLAALAAAVAALLSGAAAAKAPAVTNISDPMIARMTALFDQICLQAFPNDKAVDELALKLGARPLTAEEAKVTLVDDPGRGWEISYGNRSALIFLELPPYHACSIRWPTSADAIDLTDYRAAVARFVGSGQGFQPIDEYNADSGDIHIHATGISRMLRDGSSESLFVFDQHVKNPERRAKGETGVMLRFVRQIKSPE